MKHQTVLVEVFASLPGAPGEFGVTVTRRQGRPDVRMVFEDTETRERWCVVTMALPGGVPVPGRSTMVVRALTPGAEPRRLAEWVRVDEVPNDR